MQGFAGSGFSFAEKQQRVGPYFQIFASKILVD